MYYIVFCVLLFFSLVEVVTHKRNQIGFDAVYALMTFMLMFRYGQLTDYSSYELDYYYPGMAGIRDPFYTVITEFLKMIGISFKGYVMIIGAVTMGLAYPFFLRFCNKSVTSLLIFYTYFFLILPMSGIRQGIAVCLLLYAFHLLIENKKKLFYIVIGAGCFIHATLFTVIVIALFYDKKYFNEWYVASALAGLTIFALVTPDLTSYIPEALSNRSLGEYEENRLVQVAIRLLLILPVLYIKPKYGTFTYFAKAVCIIGYAIYCVTAFSSMISGRLEFYFRVFMCMFVAGVIYLEEKSRLRELILMGIIMVHMVIFFKNMNAFISQGDYDPDKVTMFNFPYVSIFDEDELHDYKLGQ